MDKQGLSNLITGFSTPHGFPSHINAETPGSIHEGGELGYALSVAFGAVMDKPDLVVACIVGDGEAESGPTATAWHAAKYIDPAESGAVIPIVHVNGFKISERTIYGCMDDKEMVTLFTGYGYQCRFVEDLENIVRIVIRPRREMLTICRTSILPLVCNGLLMRFGKFRKLRDLESQS